MVLKLYTTKGSSYARRVAAVLHEKQVPYELIQPNMETGEIKSVEWKKNQPFGQMPYIDDEGFILFESRAIARYISTKYASSGTPLLLADAHDANAMAILDQATSVEASNFDPYASGLVREVSFKKARGLEPEPLFVTRFETALSEKMDGFERILSKHKYMAGDNLTFVDFLYLPYGNALTNLGYDYFTNEAKYPNAARWWKEVSTRTSWLAVKDGILPSFRE